MVYKASLDSTAKRITIAVSLLFLFIISLQYVIMDPSASFAPGLVTTCLLAIYLQVFFFRPVRYVITDDELVIVRCVWNVRIQRTDIRNVSTLEQKDIAGVIRTFGVGGVFGYYGNFAGRSIGPMTWFVTRRDKLVLVKTAGNRNIILSPDQRDEFVAELSVNKGLLR
jgi:hypothetical protein